MFKHQIRIALFSLLKEGYSSEFMYIFCSYIQENTFHLPQNIDQLVKFKKIVRNCSEHQTKPTNKQMLWKHKNRWYTPLSLPCRHLNVAYCPPDCFAPWEVSFTHLHDDPVEGGLGTMRSARSVSAPRSPHGDCGLHLASKLVAVLGTGLQSKLQQLTERRERKRMDEWREGKHNEWEGRNNEWMNRRKEEMKSMKEENSKRK